MSFAAPGPSSSASAAATVAVGAPSSSRGSGGGGDGSGGGSGHNSARSSLVRRRRSASEQGGGAAVARGRDHGDEDNFNDDESSPMVHTQGRQAYASSGRASVGGHGADGMRAIEPLAPSPLYCDNAVVNSRYTLLTFLPMTTLEQFRRPLNLYFLFVAILQFIPMIAPVNPLSTLLPLLFAFSVTAIKEGLDDIKRHRADAAYNARPVWVARPGRGLMAIPSRELRVGDVLRLECDDEVPCDCVPLAVPGEAQGTCYIRTENMDGEMDLKPREVPTLVTGASVTSETPFDALCQFAASLRLDCPPPSRVVDRFDGRIVREGVTAEGSDGSILKGTAAAVDQHHLNNVCALTHHNLLLQSSYVKNTDTVFAVAVYTGNDTRCGMNKKAPAPKWAAIDRAVSRYSIFIFACQMIFAISLGIAGAVRNNGSAGAFYLAWSSPDGQTQSMRKLDWLVYPLRFFLLTSVMIPISFKFIVDMSKFWMALILEWDLSMWSSERGEGMRVKNSAIVEDLAQVEYVLSDKTGTLTQNIMKLQAATVGGEHPLLGLDRSHASVCDLAGAIGSLSSPVATGSPSTSNAAAVAPQSSSVITPAQALRELFVALAITNTVEVAHVHPHLPRPASVSGAFAAASEVGAHSSDSNLGQPGSHMRYQSISPDEEAFCDGAAAHGVALTRRSRTEAAVRVAADGGSEEVTRRYAILATCEFTNERKCMSVLIRDEATQQLWLYSKGADDRIMANLCPQSANSPLANAVLTHVASFASTGLRTLLFARRLVAPDEAQRFLAQLEEARTALTGRAAAVAAVQAAFEKGVTLLGGSGIEDKLQDDLAPTIGRLLQANVRVWMLTGDKMETAKQIAIACGLFPSRFGMVHTTPPAPMGVTSPSTASVDLRSTLASTHGDGETELIVLHGDDAADTLRSYRRTAPPRLRGPQDVDPILTDPLRTAQESVELRRALADGRYSGAVDLSAPVLSASLYQPHRGASPHFSGSVNNILYHTTVLNVDRDNRGPAVLLVEGGRTLDALLHDPTTRRQFINLAMSCSAVVCARVTPSQKAYVTQLVKEEGRITLSIGDGGNDVAMIQEAHVGVGIIGREGQQAARAADFAIVQFRDLATLMFFHGHTSYMRTALVVQYSFYKSMLISFIQVLYNILFTGMSGMSWWNSYSLTLWNGVFTLPQAICFALDRCVPRAVLERHPTLYRLSQAGYGFHPKLFAGYLLLGIVQSCALLGITVGYFNSNYADPQTGRTEDAATSSTAAYGVIIIQQVLIVCAWSSSITILNAAAIFLMPFCYWAMTAVYSSFKKLEYYGVFARANHRDDWTFIVLGVAVLALPSVLLRASLVLWRPNAAELLRMAAVTRAASAIDEATSCELADATTRSGGVGGVWRRVSLRLRRLFYQWIQREPNPLVCIDPATSGPRAAAVVRGFDYASCGNTLTATGDAASPTYGTSSTAPTAATTVGGRVSVALPVTATTGGVHTSAGGSVSVRSSSSSTATSHHQQPRRPILAALLPGSAPSAVSLVAATHGGEASRRALGYEDGHTTSADDMSVRHPSQL